MSLEAIRNAAEMTAGEAAPLLDLPPFMVLRFANRLVRLGYATSNDECYLATIAGCEIDAVMQGSRP
jgi:hypothetical protein